MRCLQYQNCYSVNFHTDGRYCEMNTLGPGGYGETKYRRRLSNTTVINCFTVDSHSRLLHFCFHFKCLYLFQPQIFFLFSTLFLNVWLVSLLSFKGEKIKGQQMMPYNAWLEQVHMVTTPLIFVTVLQNELMFRATPGVWLSVNDFWLGKTIPPTAQDTCVLKESTSCSTHYRNPRVDIWKSLSI